MDRIKISLPESFLFSTVLRIRITDLNYGGHVGNDSFLSLVHEARQQYLAYHGYSEMNFAGSSLIMADVAIEYKAELSYGNEVRISVAAGGFDKIGFDLYYLIELVTSDRTIIAGKVKTGMMCFDYQQKKRMPVPAEAINKMSPF